MILLAIYIFNYLVYNMVMIFVAGRIDYTLSKETQEEGFGIDSNELASIVRGHDTKGFNTHGV